MRAGLSILLLALCASAPAEAERRSGGPRLVKATPTAQSRAVVASGLARRQLLVLHRQNRVVDFTARSGPGRSTSRRLRRGQPGVADHPGRGPLLQNAFRLQRGQTLAIILPALPPGSARYEVAGGESQIVAQRSLPGGKHVALVRPTGDDDRQLVTLSADRGSRAYRVLVQLESARPRVN